MVRVPCCERMGQKKGPWTAEEDQILISYIQRYGHENWRALPKQAGLLRCGKSCRLRWTNYLRPDIKRGNFSKEEEETIIKLHQMLGNRWSAIATKLPGRTDNEIKNFWHSHLKKRVKENPATAAAARRLTCSSLQTSIIETNDNPRIPETSISHHHPGFLSSDDYSCGFAAKQDQKLQTNTGGPAPQITSGDRKSAQDISLRVDLESRARILSSGQCMISQPGNHCMSSDMVFWYNLFVNAGENQEKIA